MTTRRGFERCTGIRRLAACLFAGLALAGAALADLPDAFVEYVESDGTQYIDTGVIGRCGTSADMTITWLDNADRAILGSRKDGGNTRFVLCNNGSKAYYASHRIWTKWGSVNASSDRDRVVSSITNDDSNVYIKLTVNGSVGYEETQDITQYPAYDTGLSMYLFAQHRADKTGGVDIYSKVRCYSLKIWQDDVLVRDFKPCKKDGRAALYDEVTKSIFYPVGGELAAGEVTQTIEVPDAFVEYVESNGSQYIDTGIIGKCNTCADVTIQWMGGGDSSFLSSRVNDGDTRFVLCSNQGDVGDEKHYYIAHGKYEKSSDVSKSQYSVTTPDRIVSSITHDGTSVTYTMSVNGTTEINVTRDEEALDTELNMYLFAQNKNGSAVLKSRVRCYGVKIWQNGALVRDYRPCVKNNTAGLYDDVSKTIFYPQGGDLTASGNEVKVPGKPDHFVQFVESTGTQYLDTDVVGKCNTSADMTITWIGTADASFLSSRTDNGSTRFILCSNNKGGNGYYAGHRNFYFSNPKRTGSELDHIVSSITRTGTNVLVKMTINNEQVVNETKYNETPLDTGLTMYLFAQHKGDKAGGVDVKSMVRCYGVKIWQYGKLVREFRPCIKDDRAGLYDEVSGWIFFPQGGDLVYPNETPDKFVKWANLTGGSSFDVQVRAKSGIRSEMKYRPSSDDAENQYLLAARNGDNRFLLGYYYNPYAQFNIERNRIAVGYKDKWNQCEWSEHVIGKDYVLEAEISAAGVVRGACDGVEKSAGDALGALDTGLNLRMFGINYDGKAQDFFVGRCYYSKIWEWDETANDYVLVRDFRPCVKDEYVAFYDDVSKTLFRPFPAIPAEGNVCKPGLIITFK